jgi:hypothetical protein
MRAAFAGVVLAAALTLTGCATTSGGLGAGTATALQQEVRHIADLAAAHRYPAALAAATALRSDLRAAVDTGRVPGDRATRIRAALDLVETDLRTAQRAAPPTATPSPTPTATPTSTPTATPSATATAAPAKRAWKPKPAPAPVWPKKEHGKKGHGGRGKDR